jgi:hypothetical protein
VVADDATAAARANQVALRWLPSTLCSLTFGGLLPAKPRRAW